MKKIIQMSIMRFLRPYVKILIFEELSKSIVIEGNLTVSGKISTEDITARCFHMDDEKTNR